VKTLLLPLLCLLSAAAAATAGDRVEVKRDGVTQNTRSTNEAIAALEARVVGLLAACDVDSTAYVVTPDVWQRKLAEATFVRVRLAPARPIATRIGEVLADEILVPLPNPGHVYVRHGEVVRAYTKFHPEALLALAQDPAIGLGDTQRYRFLARYLVAGPITHAQVSIVRDSMQRLETPDADLGAKLARLLYQSQVELTPEMTAVSAHFFNWHASLDLPDFVLVRFEQPRNITLRNGLSLEVQELLLPMPQGEWPGPLLVRQGNSARAFTKYSPSDLEAVTRDPALAQVFPRRCSGDCPTP
jgi:hypothetical protein